MRCSLSCLTKTPTSLGRQDGSSGTSVEHITDLVRVAPMVQILDAPVPQTVDQVPEVLQFFDTLTTDPEHVIEDLS